MKGFQKKRLLIGNFTIKTGRKTENRMVGRLPEGHIIDPKNTRMEEMCRRQRRMEASSEEGKGPEGAVVA
jgi:hypothetical protein